MKANHFARPVHSGPDLAYPSYIRMAGELRARINAITRLPDTTSQFTFNEHVMNRECIVRIWEPH